MFFQRKYVHRLRSYVGKILITNTETDNARFFFFISNDCNRIWQYFYKLQISNCKKVTYDVLLEINLYQFTMICIICKIDRFILWFRFPLSIFFGFLNWISMKTLFALRHQVIALFLCDYRKP